MKSLRTWILWLPCVTASLAALALLFHALHLARQTDVQHIGNAFELLQSIQQGHPWSYLLFPKKYPLLSVLPLSVLYAATLFILFLAGRIPALSAPAIQAYLFSGPSAIHFVTRMTTVVFAVALVWMVYRMSRKLFPKTPALFAVLLLLSSMLFLTFMTSMRQHMVEVTLTFLTFSLSFSLSEDKSRTNILLAFGSAVIAFCVLQNGIFAFIFPVWAMASEGGRLLPRRWLRPKIIWIVIACLFISTLLGYPFLWRDLFVRHMLGFGLGNEDIGSSPWGFNGFFVGLRTLIGSETFPTLFAALGLWRWRRGLVRLHPFLLSIAVYAVLYFIFFGFVGWTTSRYFFPLVPFLALIGGDGLASVRFFHLPFALLLLAVHLQFMVLGLRPDTYDIAHLALLTRTTGSIATTFPHYFLDIPPTRDSIRVPTTSVREQYLLSLPEDAPGARPFVPVTAYETAGVALIPPNYSLALPSPWFLCEDITAASTVQNMFLWSEVDWPFVWIFQTRHLGPSMKMYCRR